MPAKMQKIRKAIIPVAGMGTRFLPATKAQPKEMLPVVDKPVIQYIVEEAVAAGIEEIIFVTAMGKRALEDHFDRNFELEYRLEQKHKMKELEAIEKIGKLAKFAFVRQQKPLGDGHAILAAAPFVGKDEAVAVLFGDDIISGGQPAIGELISAYERFDAPIAAIQEVPRDKISSYGIIDGVEIDGNTWEVKKFVEKPEPEDAPSNLGIVGRYVITPKIFQLLAKQKPGKDGEIRLADAFITLVESGKSMYGYKFSGNRYDCGNKLQFIIAQIELGLEHPEVGEGLAEYLRNR
ncbi:MAG: UTP--glucose-1-phosphate uridylyltransferase GalU [Patescibacteria group bacterium]|jgi:UTP--glucose-1-phosphate uridylyltransferase